MSDNKLKIRIQIQQPQIPEEAGETEVTGESIPDIDTQDYLEKPPFDWRKISLALVLFVAVIGLISVLLFSQGDDEADIDSNHLETDNSADPTANFNYFDDSVASTPDEQADFTAVTENENSLSEIKDAAVTAENTTKSESSSKQIVIPDSKPDHAKKQLPPAPALKPESVADNRQMTAPQNDGNSETLTSLIPDAPDHPKVIRAQLTHAVKQREPVDEINHVRLEQNSRKSIYFFVELHDLTGQQVTVNWYYNDQPVTETKLRIGGKNWRTYANKLLNNKSLGPWRAVLTDEDGKQLSERHFVVSNHM